MDFERLLRGMSLLISLEVQIAGTQEDLNRGSFCEEVNKWKKVNVGKDDGEIS